jgi:hypothetical protein
MVTDSLAIHRRGRRLAALVVTVVMVAAIGQQFVPHLQLPMQFADAPRRLPAPVAALFPVVSTIVQLVALTSVTRWFDRRNAGPWAASVAAMLVGVSVATAMTFTSAAILGTVSPIKTAPSSWTDYAGTDVDSYGTLGTFSVDVQDASLLVHRRDGGTIGSGSLTQVDDDEWALPSSPYEGVFWRDDAGAVIEIVTRLGVPVRVGTDGG